MNQLQSNRYKAPLFLLLVFCLGFVSLSNAQVSIAPTSLYFDNQQRVSSLTVSNGGQKAQEISISTEFGFPTSENGSLIISDDSTLAEKKSMTNWANGLRVFPKSFTLQPQTRQAVQFIVKPPADLEAGGYWARVKIQSNPVSPPIESVGENQVGAQINLVVNQVIAAHYRTQNAKTGVEVTSIDYSQNEGTGQISLSMKQNRNAPFIGSINLQVKNSSGQTVYQTNTTNSVYTTITRSFNLDVTDFEPGKYTVSGNITSDRRDVSQENLLQIRPVSFQKQITIE